MGEYLQWCITSWGDEGHVRHDAKTNELRDMHSSKVKGWSAARRARQAEAINRWKPWEKSTGPKSEEGKARSAMRGYKGGTRKTLREVARILREQAEALKKIE